MMMMMMMMMIVIYDEDRVDVLVLIKDNYDDSE